MATNPTINRANLFERYERALTGLASIPGHLENDLADARAVYDTAVSAAASAVVDDEQRLARLHRNLTTSFSGCAQLLRGANVLVPQQVRLAADQKGDPSSLTAAVNSQFEAEKAVKLELQAAGDRSRGAAGQEAADALRRRQEMIRKATAETQADVEKPQKQRRPLMILGGLGVLILFAMLVLLLS